MRIDLMRSYYTDTVTMGMMTIQGTGLAWFTLEDTCRDLSKEKKVWGETCIPHGLYKVGLRTEGQQIKDYIRSYGKEFHKHGMVEIQGVKGFKYIHIHSGNTKDNTNGCPLLGKCASLEGEKIWKSRVAYMEFYPLVRDCLLKGEEVTILVQ